MKGTVADNIARFQKVNDEEVIAAAQLAGCPRSHTALPQTYLTPIGEAAASFPAGNGNVLRWQERFIVSRALVVLDEPSSNLDANGEAALRDTIRKLKAKGITVVAIEHKVHLLTVADKVLLMSGNGAGRFSDRDDFLSGSRGLAPLQPSPLQSPRC